MAWMDFSAVVLSPYLTDRFDVIRRTDTINTHGRSVPRTETLRGKVGVITAASPNDLARLPEAQVQGRSLSIVTKFPLFGMGVANQPDLIVWNGDHFVVLNLEPYPQFGAGFYQSIVSSVDYQDYDIPFQGQADFSVASNSQLVPTICC